VLKKKQRQDETQFTTKIGEKKLAEVLKKKQRQDETQFTTKIGEKN
jgi:transposase-like protein